MCGIAGIMSIKRIDNIDSRMSRMLSVMYHRGPDSGGKKIVDNHLAFGHRRLAILDIDPRSDQPMISCNGNIFTYNGEVYNYKDIKRKLIYKFNTESDTEVIMAGIEQHGIKWTLNECNGMFAFSYYDKESDKLYIARDRMGIKPLFYYISDGLFIYASEIKSILNSGLIKAEINENAIDEYLGNRYVRAPYTFFKNIYQVMPGHYLVVDRQCRIKDCVYWQLPSKFNTKTNYNEEEILEEFRDEVVNSIKRRMISDVPLGTYLSGGVDSSLITAVASENKSDTLETFTIGFPELNEFKYARLVSERYKTHHHEIIMTDANYFDMMDEVIGYKDAPLGVPNEIPLAQMSKELKKYITVVLSGEGADELMGGYGRIFRSSFDYSNHRGIATSFYDYFISLYEYTPRSFRDKYLTTSFASRELYDNKCKTMFNDLVGEEAIFRFFHTYHVQGLLQRCDTTTMLASVEARVPFLDHTLIEYTYKNVPYELKLKWKSVNRKNIAKKEFSNQYSEIFDIPKYLLREVAYQYLPIEVIERKKVGFPVPLNQWISNLSIKAKDILKDANWINTSRLDDMILECQKMSRGGQILWMLINIEMFRKKYFNKEWRY